MRSLIKSHKRSSSSEIRPHSFTSPSTVEEQSSATNEVTDTSRSSKPVISPLSTPNLQKLSYSQFTPPPPPPPPAPPPPLSSSNHNQSSINGSSTYERGSSASVSSISSPKKLLTPIKKLFSSTSYKHHSVPVSGDSLAQITSSSGRRSSRIRKSGGGGGTTPSSYVSLTKLAEQSANVPIVATKLEMTDNSGQSLSTPIKLMSEPHLQASYDSGDELITMSSNAPSFVKGEEHFKRVNIKDDNNNPKTPNLSSDVLNDVTPIIDLSVEKFTRFEINNNQLKDKDDDDNHLRFYSSDESSSSSQFSFVKDMKGGRNTSIKYYKTGTPSQNLEKIFSNATNVFDTEQLGNDMDGMSDYDYDNNGEDEDYDDYEDTGRYNNLFGDDDFEDNHAYVDDLEEVNLPNPELDDMQLESRCFDDDVQSGSFYSSRNDNENITTPTLFIIDSSYLNRINSISLMKTQSTRPYHRSYHMSINGIDKLDSLDSVKVELAGPFHQELLKSSDDILENYLEIHLKSESPPACDDEIHQSESVVLESSDETNTNSTNDMIVNTPDMASVDCLGLFDISSPMVNGITVGANLRHRFPKNDSEDNFNLNRSFINRERTLPEGKFEKLDFEIEASSKHSLIVPRNEREVLKLRSVKSFHSSISDTMELRIQEKLKSLESYLSTNEVPPLHAFQPHNPEVGLGLVYSPPSTSVEDIAVKPLMESNLQRKLEDNIELDPISQRGEKRKSLRDSVLSMMDLLGNLEKRFSNPNSDAAVGAFSNNDTSNVADTGVSSQHLSITNMMNILADLEKNQKEIVEERDKELKEAKANRDSILGMMSTLAKLESDTPDISPAEKKRDSINKMMATLATLTVLLTAESRPRRKSSEKRDSKAIRSYLASMKKTMKPRYSWFDNDESVQFKFKENTVVPPPIPEVSKAQRYSFGESLVTEASNPILYDDLLDEVNKLPEDFDFDEYELSIERIKSQKLNQPEFFRSNSYNKKPVKSLIGQNFASNKIETLNKTVTFYNKHVGNNNLEVTLNESLSRGPSIRSVNSFASVNEEDEGESSLEYESQQSSYYNDYPKKNLTTITESPNIR